MENFLLSDVVVTSVETEFRLGPHSTHTLPTVVAGVLAKAWSLLQRHWECMQAAFGKNTDV